MRSNHFGVIGEIDSLPGCSQVAVFHSVFNPGEKAKGKGSAAHALRIDDARYLGYNLAICTVDLNNSNQLKILEKFNWKQVQTFVSSKTGHQVGLFVREIQ